MEWAGLALILDKTRGNGAPPLQETPPYKPLQNDVVGARVCFAPCNILSLRLALILDNLRRLASQGKWNEFRISANPRQFALFSVARHTFAGAFEFRVRANPRQFTLFSVAGQVE